MKDSFEEKFNTSTKVTLFAWYKKDVLSVFST